MLIRKMWKSYNSFISHYPNKIQSSFKLLPYLLFRTFQVLALKHFPLDEVFYVYRLSKRVGGKPETPDSAEVQQSGEHHHAGFRSHFLALIDE